MHVCPSIWVAPVTDHAMFATLQDLHFPEPPAPFTRKTSNAATDTEMANVETGAQYK